MSENEIRGEPELVSHMDEQQNVEVQEAPENVVQISEGPRKVSKIEQKRQQIMAQRIQRYVNEGRTVEQAQIAIARDDYDRLPIDQKVGRLEKIIANNVRGMVGDIQALRRNQDELANVMDVNFRVFSKMLVKLGITEADQKAFFEDATKEIEAEMLAAQVSAQVAAEQDAVAAEKKDVVDQMDKEGEPIEPPDADTFGG